MYDGSTRIRLDGRDVHHLARVACFANHAVIPEEQLLVIDPALPLDRAALVGCAVMTGVGAATNTVRMQTGASVAVFGCGGVGLNVVQGARLQGAATVIAVDLHDAALEMAREFGASHLVRADQCDPVASIQEITGGGADHSFDAIGSARTIKQALDSVRAGGSAVIVGIAPYGQMAEIDPFTLVLQEKALLGSFYGSSRPRLDMPGLLALHGQGRLKLDELITRTYSLEQVNEAYSDLAGGGAGRGMILTA